MKLDAKTKIKDIKCRKCSYVKKGVLLETKKMARISDDYPPQYVTFITCPKCQEDNRIRF